MLNVANNAAPSVNITPALSAKQITYFKTNRVSHAPQLANYAKTTAVRSAVKAISEIKTLIAHHA